MRRVLDLIYSACGALAVLFLVMIAVLTVAQVVARLMGTLIPSADDFAGYCMAGAVFLGLAYTLRAGIHVRVLTVLTHVPKGMRRALELGCAGLAALIVAAMVYYTVDMIDTTRSLNEYTIGLIPVPKWIPMLLMLAGLLVLLIALLDAFVQLARGQTPSYIVREEEQASSIPASSE
jgi:TRAP-type C4-dicarboxylate transport system permease small subunit